MILSNQTEIRDHHLNKPFLLTLEHVFPHLAVMLNQLPQEQCHFDNLIHL